VVWPLLLFLAWEFIILRGRVDYKLRNENMKQSIDNTTIGFESAVARKTAQLSALAFLAALGFIPGWERLFGFSGFSGFFGVAIIIEMVHRLKNRNA